MAGGSERQIKRRGNNAGNVMDMQGLYRYFRKLRHDNALRRHIPAIIKKKFYITVRDGKLKLIRKKINEQNL